MADADTNTIRYVGDTGPPIKLQASDETGYLTTLPTASSLSLLAVNKANPADTFGGTAVVIDPPEADADTVHHWNAKYVLAVGDTVAAGTFDLYLDVTWADATIQTFAVCTLEIKAKN